MPSIQLQPPSAITTMARQGERPSRIHRVSHALFRSQNASSGRDRAGDLDNNGGADLVVTYATTNQIALLLNTCSP
jgi:hypothetical protein